MYLGIDLGTSGVKLVLINDQQETIGQSTAKLTVSQPHPLWSEQNPEDWWQATCFAVNELKKTHAKEFSAIKAIGLSGQQHGATMLDAQGNVLRPAILWNDGRAAKECEFFSEKIPNYTQIIGAKMMPGFTAPKIMWVKQHEPDIYHRIAKVVLPKDYLRFKMTNEFATDMSDASGTGWLDIEKRTWSHEMLNASGFSTTHMPQLFEGSAVTSTLSKEIAEAWGLMQTTKVVGGGGDNPAAAMSINVIEEGSAFLSLGTSGVYFVASDTYKTNHQNGLHSFCHCLPNRWHYMTVHLSAASCLSWFAKSMQISEMELLKEAENAKESVETLLFLPYLSGERSPHNNPHARGVFFGLSHQTSRAHMTRAILEGVAFAFADGQDAMINAGVDIQKVFVVGGGAQSLFWGKILASVLNRPLIYSKNREVGAAVGAARLAWYSLNPSQTLNFTSEIEAIVEPDSSLVTQYQIQRKKFQALYSRLEDFFITSSL